MQLRFFTKCVCTVDAQQGRKPTRLKLQVGVAIWETMEMGSLSVEPVNQGWNCANAMPVTLFESPSTPESRKAFVEREHEFRFVKVYPEAEERPAVLCCKGSNQLVRGRCGTEAEFRERYGQYGLEQVWRKDVLPCRPYLRHCVLAAEKLGIKEEFLASTFLSDGETSLHAYLEQNPSIMSEEPPVSLEDRYGG